MKDLKEVMKKRLSERFLGNQAIGLLALRAINKFLGREDLVGYVKFNKIFLNIIDQSLKITIFRERLKLIEAVNKHLASFGYDVKMADIIIKGRSNDASVFEEDCY